MFGDEVEKLPLRHEGDEAAMSRKMSEIGQHGGFGADLAGEFAHFLVGTLQKFVQNPQLVHDFEGGGMNGVAAEVAEEIGVLLEHHDVNRHPRKKKAQHHARWSASDDAAARSQYLRHARKYTLAALDLDSGS